MLADDDARAFVAGYSHLWSETLHPDGGAWSVTAPVALVVAGLLDDPRLGPDDPSIRDALLAYLHRVAVAGDLGAEAEEFRARGERAAALACYDAAPELLSAVVPHLVADRPQQQACAAAAIGRLARHPAAAAQRPALLDRIERLAEHATGAYERATLVYAIGDLGGEPRRWLDDPTPAVRGSAAVAETLAQDKAAVQVLLTLARSPRAFGASLGDMAAPVQFMVRPCRDQLAEALVRRSDDLSALLPCALAAVTLAPRSAAHPLAPYLRAFFPDGAPVPPLPPLHRAFAGAIAGEAALWRLPEAARTALFAPNGLTARPEDWMAMAATVPPPAEDYDAAHIVVFEGFTAVRRYPGMFFGVGRDDPSLPDRVVQVLHTEYTEAVAAGVVGSFALRIASPTRLVLDVHGHGLPGTEQRGSFDLDGVFGRLANHWPALHLSLVSALCRRVDVRVRAGGRALTGTYVDGLALGAPAEERDDECVEPGAEGTLTGYRVTFDLDTDWFPADSRISDGAAADG
ncbi:hypothetical protein [Kitasatospora paranensis]|uniref:hypothetical protein n=1 Tax=Kitasatospora paranensis TaxID=258053 RepID=UPI0036212906